ncbi:UDP-glucuronate:xylan alpha-glucuronosyltransferase 1 [Lathyrus oleraceus]|uniref:UDP-glucuronate:xylan alpha-glucuronosyltransferase 1 n=1 Tax=Pisum sativum TaxID=3888 RepID=A0A9D4XPM9_PEA|nr:UDP-glucuronate:xylan alpha-glucuronosyltransferase 1 [Pisum sativum]
MCFSLPTVFSIPHLFACKELVGREGNVWLYRPNSREKVRLPVGSCELALPMRGRELAHNGNAPREAYATILHSAHVYVCGAIE